MTDAKGLSEEEVRECINWTLKILDFESPTTDRLVEIADAYAALAERLKFMEAERDRLRDTKWEGIVELEERLKCLEKELEECKKNGAQ